MKGKPIKTLCALVSTFFLSCVIGCGDGKSENNNEKANQSFTYTQLSIEELKKDATYDGKYVEIKGIPLGVSHGTIHNGRWASGNEFAIIVKEKDHHILANSEGSGSFFDHYRNSVDATALIQSEMNDGDEETITIKGKYDHKASRVYIDTVIANGYEVKLKR